MDPDGEWGIIRRMPFMPQAYLNGQWIDASQAAIPVFDAGFVLGATISEQLRTFKGELFELDQHLARLERSLAVVGIPLPEPVERIAEIATRLVTQNVTGLAPTSDLGLAILVTPGPYATLSPGIAVGPTLCLHTYPLPFELWAGKYAAGQHLVVTDVRQVPPACWPPEIKCRSRMHYYLADREASLREAGARALLVDLDGFVSETSTANVLAWFEREGLVSPPRDLILPGISLAVTRELAAELGMACSERPLTTAELAAADEVLLTSTPFCILSATGLDGRPISAGKPGPIFRQLLAAWNGRAGMDVMQQALQATGGEQK